MEGKKIEFGRYGLEAWNMSRIRLIGIACFGKVRREIRQRCLFSIFPFYRIFLLLQSWKRVQAWKAGIIRKWRLDDDIVDGFFVFSGDKWLVSCLGVLHLSKGLFYRVVPADQGFGSSEDGGPLTLTERQSSPAESSYSGVFRFRLWWCGAWAEVLVDDRLPAVHGRLAFIQCRHSDQFWPALLEKAYAK